MKPSGIKKRDATGTRFFLVLMVCMILINFKGVGQAIILKGDTLPLGGDSLVHLVMLPFRGTLQWEFSDDSTHWNRIAATNGDTLTVRGDHERYFRAVITEGSCDPLISGIVQILHFPPIVHTGRVTRLDIDIATIQGEVTSDGGASVISRGICFSLSPLPTIDDHTVTSGAGTGPFSATLTGLTPDSDWYARAFATNSKGTAYGEAVSFRTLPVASPTVTDIDGNVYPILKIGEQWWMALNLRVTRAPDGSSITSNEYPDDPEKAEFYGRYYSWDVAMNYSREESAQGICPDGWHLPSDDEVKLMEIALGMNPSEVHVINGWRGAGVGTKMKPGGSSQLDIPLAGLWYPGNLVLFENESAYFYTSTEAGANAWRRCLSHTSSGVGRYDTFPKSYGFSIRCIKDN